MSRGDGAKISFERKSNGKGGFTTSDNKNLTSNMIWHEKCKYHKNKEEMVERSVFMTTWQNDNEWLPITRIDFEHIEKNANVAIFAITGLKQI